MDGGVQIVTLVSFLTNCETRSFFSFFKAVTLILNYNTPKIYYKLKFTNVYYITWYYIYVREDYMMHTVFPFLQMCSYVGEFNLICKISFLFFFKNKNSYFLLHAK